MSFAWDFPYPSQRMPVLARNVVATSQPLAAQAGLRMLLKGGNAVDAALAAAIALTVVEPTSNGIGSDAFAILWDGRKLHGLNSSGRSPRALSPGRFAGRTALPTLGWDTVTVPGAVAAWAALSQRFGALAFADLFEPALDYAARGFPVAPITAARWQDAHVRYPDFPEIQRAFFPGGRAPHAGEVFRCPSQAETLAAIAHTSGEAFYRGPLARAIADCAAAEGGLMTAEDLAAHRADWVEPIAVDYGGARLHEIPPNGQGIAALIALGILRHLAPGRFAVDSAESLHLQIEAMKHAFSDAFRHVGDPACMEVTSAELLQEDRLAAAAAEIRMDTAATLGTARPAGGGTVYLTAADASGMMVSYIQSNYLGFGSGVVVPGTGIALAKPRARVHPHGGPPELRCGGKAPLPHHHPRLRHTLRATAHELRGHGRAHAAPGACSDDGAGFRLRAESTGRLRCPAMARGAGRQRAARTGLPARHPRRAGAPRSPGLDHRAPLPLWRRAADPPPRGRVRGRLGLAQGWAGGRLLRARSATPTRSILSLMIETPAGFN